MYCVYRVICLCREQEDFVDTAVIQERFDRLVVVQNRISGERNAEAVGKTMEVLSEGPSRKDAGVATTRSRAGKVVHIDGLIPAGSFLDVEIVGSAQHHLVGSRI